MLAIFVFLLGSLAFAAAPLQRLQLQDSLKISDVWSGHPVDFTFVERGDSQYVAYYDTLRRMTVAMRPTQSNTLRYVNLPSAIGWDSHNYIAMALDSLGYIHVSGNMHAAPLVYFRSMAPFKIDSIRASSMVGLQETSVTYPVFFNGPSGDLLFMYRDGASGNGNQIFDKWTIVPKKWSRLFDRPLFDGQGLRNAYMGGPIPGPDGYYHIYWMWRETADAATTHDVSYIRSKDLVNWETAGGVKLTLPITASTKGVRVDSIPQHGGLINRGAIGFDSQKRLTISYHKFDAAGYTQLYNARWENTQWKIYQTSAWTYRWDFGGAGTLALNITFGPITLEPNGSLTQSYYHVKNGTGIWELDEATLKPKSILGTSLWPASLEAPQHPGMTVHWLKSAGIISLAGSFFNSTSTPAKDPSVVNALRWETMPENQDQPRSPIPAPTSLMMYKFKDPNAAAVVALPPPQGRKSPAAPFIAASGKKVTLNLPPSWSGEGAARMEIVDIQGKIVRTLRLAALENAMIRPGGLQPGLYMALIYKVQNKCFPESLLLTFMVSR
jgi:hypothetical protein